MTYRTSSAHSRLTGAAIGAIAALGLLAAHVVDYVLVVRDPSVRRHLLAATGHGYLPRALTATAIGAIAAGLVIASTGFTRRPAPLAGRALFVRLATVQAVGFVALELLERVHAGIPVHHMVEATLPVGVALQVAAAALGVLFVRGLRRAGIALHAFLTRPATPRGITAFTSSLVALVRTCVAPSPAAPRGPPALTGSTI